MDNSKTRSKSNSKTRSKSKSKSKSVSKYRGLSLQALALRKLPPEFIETIPSPIKDEARHGLARQIQKMFSRQRKTGRDGRFMTMAAMRRQLLDFFGGIDCRQFNNAIRMPSRSIQSDLVGTTRYQEDYFILDNISKPFMTKMYVTWVDEGLSEHKASRIPLLTMRKAVKQYLTGLYCKEQIWDEVLDGMSNDAKKKYLLNNIDRPLLIKVYNNMVGPLYRRFDEV